VASSSSSSSRLQVLGVRLPLLLLLRGGWAVRALEGVVAEAGSSSKVSANSSSSRARQALLEQQQQQVQVAMQQAMQQGQYVW
jgi:hypothetical protein